MKANYLIHESSPYLLQHAYNPVEWYAWGETAFERARAEDKPILVSIGYAACHWCHVMEHESFEDETIAAFMNKYFINIKVDREERTDVDHIYMNACQLLTGAGGWPLNMFLTPALQPFTGGTYFPPKPAYGKASWMDVLVYVHEIFTSGRDKVEEQAQSLADHILKMDAALIQPLQSLGSVEKEFTDKELELCVKGMKNNFDPVNGGFGSAPKFPGSMSLRFLLRANYFRPDEEIENHIQLSLNKMMNGGIYDQAGGGFSRYTVDTKWHVPHFEKMLYDNALLISLYAEAYMIRQDPDWRNLIIQTLAFLEREMMDAGGGFYASYDADSEGVEGKYYTWQKSEIELLFGDKSTFVCRLYDITETGNWEHTNILHRTVSDDQLCVEFKCTQAALSDQIKSVNQRLLEERNKRIKPGLDNKIVLSWNALMISAYVQAYKALRVDHYKTIAENCLQFILTEMKGQNGDGTFHHTYQNGQAKHPAFLEDYASCIQACLDVYEITGNSIYLIQAISIQNYLDTYFAGGNMYYFTHRDQLDIPLRQKEFYDNATPSGNSIMLQNLIRLSALTGERKYEKQAVNMFAEIRQTVVKHGTSFGNWLSAALAILFPFAEVIVTGENAQKIAAEINHIYYPHQAVQFDETGEREGELFKGRFNFEIDQIYLCKQGTCSLPVNNLQDYLIQLATF